MKPDLTSVNTLVTSPSALAEHLQLTTNAIRRWMKVNRIPGSSVIKVANFYDVELVDLLPLTGSEKSNETRVSLKPRLVLQTLMDVFRGTISFQQALDITGQSSISLKLILTHWGDELPTLYTTLEQLDQRRISLDEASARLRVTKNTMNGIRRKYGYAPGPTPRVRPLPTVGTRTQANKEIALCCIAGKYTAKEAAELHGVSQRTIFRAVDKLSDIGLGELAGWPLVFREAYAAEIEREMFKFAQKWLELARNMRLFIEKSPKYPKTPETWRNQPVKRLLVGVLLAEASFEEVAKSRGAEPQILRSIFNNDLQNLGVDFDSLESMPIQHQVAVAEILIAMMERKRKVVV